MIWGDGGWPSEDEVMQNMELRKINMQDVAAQWEYTTALPADENGLTKEYFVKRVNRNLYEAVEKDIFHN